MEGSVTLIGGGAGDADQLRPFRDLGGDEGCEFLGPAAHRLAALLGQLPPHLLRAERGREKAFVLKPMEFMNLSGYAVQRAASFHGVELANILVVHDEIDLELGIVRLKNGGGHGGHNGLRSIHEQLGSGGFARLRMGVGRDPNKPPGSKDAAGWVLSDFPSAQHPTVDAMISAGCECIETTLALGIVAAMNKHNARPKL